jgi:transcriptional regulator with GAF, ATPase, and Fis domain
VTIETLDDETAPRRSRDAAPGVVVVFSGGRPMWRPHPLRRHPLALGRQCPDGATIDDPRMSREHAEVAFGATVWRVRDLGSRNGTHVDGRPITGVVTCARPPVLRFGGTVALAVNDVLPFLQTPALRSGDVVAGPTWRTAMAEIALVATSSQDLLLHGESGCGKELAALHFHAAGARAGGPFVAVNCAAIPPGLAERLLFGAVKGAYSGAASDAEGYIEAAEGGVLFLDEFGDLEPTVQAKLLRVLESKEALRLGASRARRVDVSFCFATHRDLRAAVAGGAFRADLYYRVSSSTVRLPPLRERPEEIPWLAQLAVDTAVPGLNLSAALVEAAMVRPWPGNVRELVGAIRHAARCARGRSLSAIGPDLLATDAGLASEAADLAASAPRKPVTADEVAHALRESPNVAAAARRLGVHRSHLYRLIGQFGIDVQASASSTK